MDSKQNQMEKSLKMRLITSPQALATIKDGPLRIQIDFCHVSC
jgi:hypothetical protein